jgi:hypothetical protein
MDFRGSEQELEQCCGSPAGAGIAACAIDAAPELQSSVNKSLSQARTAA